MTCYMYIFNYVLPVDYRSQAFPFDFHCLYGRASKRNLSRRNKTDLGARTRLRLPSKLMIVGPIKLLLPVRKDVQITYLKIVEHIPKNGKKLK